MKAKYSRPYLGVIAEDDSDIKSILILAKRISNIDKLPFERFKGDGSSKIINKCFRWSEILKSKGCNLLIIVHDSDTKNPLHLREIINRSLKESTFKKKAIVIPVQEIEAWFLSDPEGIKKALKLRKAPSVKNNPETINSPKEHLKRIIHQIDRNKRYLNTIDNPKIAGYVAVKTILEKCPSFTDFYDFISSNIG